MRTFTLPRSFRLALPLALALVPTPPSPAAAVPYAQGEKVEFTGMVTDRQGTPISDVQVMLECSRKRIDWRRLERVKRHPIRVSTPVDENGRFSIQWPWNDFYNSYELLVTVPVRKGGAERLHVLARASVTEKTTHGSPVVAALVVEDISFLEELRRFQAALDTEDEKRVYRDVGKPDRLESLPRAGGEETAWWYFRLGRVYRFRDGVFQGVETFEPIRGFDGDAAEPAPLPAP